MSGVTRRLRSTGIVSSGMGSSGLGRLRILVRADQLVRQRIDHQQMSGPDVVGIDLVAAEHELMRALQTDLRTTV